MFAATKSFFTNEATAGALTPSWVLDFSVGTPSGYTFTRSANTATYVNSSGYIASANADVPRLTHDKNGTQLGLLIEGQRQNLAQRSGEFENAWWNGGTGTTAAGVSSPTAPDNSTDAAELKETTAASAHYKQRNFIAVTSGTITWSAYVKKQSRQYVGIRVSSTNSYNVIFDLDNNAAFSAARSVGTPNGSYGSEDVGNGWYRLWITMTTGGSGTVNTYPAVFLSDRAGFTGTLSDNLPSYTGSTSESVYVWGLQYETASTPSSYIPTTNATVTRNDDLAYVLDSGITGWQSPGGLVVHFYPPTQTGAIISTEDAIAEQLGIQCNTLTTARAYWSSGNTSTSTLTTGVQKAVHYWNGTASSFCLNAGTVHTQTNNVTTFGNIDFVTFGAQASDNAGIPGLYSSFTNVIIQKIEFYGQSLTSADLQTITA